MVIFTSYLDKETLRFVSHKVGLPPGPPDEFSDMKYNFVQPCNDKIKHKE